MLFRILNGGLPIKFSFNTALMCLLLTSDADLNSNSEGRSSDRRKGVVDISALHIMEKLTNWILGGECSTKMS